MIGNYKSFIKKIVIQTPFEMTFRERFTNKKNYQFINLKLFNKYKLLDERNLLNKTDKMTMALMVAMPKIFCLKINI